MTLKNGMPIKPQLRRYLRTVPDADGGLSFRGGGTAVKLTGKSVSELLPDLLAKLDGQRTVAQIASELPHVDHDVIVEAMEFLNAQNLLEEVEKNLPTVSDSSTLLSSLTRQRNFWTSLAASPSEIEANLARSTVVVAGLGEVGSQIADLLARSGVGAFRLADDRSKNQSRSAAVADHLRSLGVEAEPVPWGSADNPLAGFALDDVSIIILASDAPGDMEPSILNKTAIEHDVPWMAAMLGDAQAIVGPFVIPGKSPCYECLLARLAANCSPILPAQGMAWGHDDTASVADEGAFPVFFASMVAATAAGEAIRYLSGSARPISIGGFLKLDPLTAATTHHEVLKLPRCTVCGPARYRPQPKIWDFDESIGNAP